MVLLTSKIVLITLAAGVVGYLVLLLPALHEIPLSLVTVEVKEALSVVVKSWWTPISSTVVSSFTSYNDDSPKKQEESAAAVAPQKRKRTLMEQKFAIDGPELNWDMATIALDYQLAEWVTNGVLDYALYDWECRNKLDVSEPTGWNVMVPEMIGPVQVEVPAEGVDIGQGSSEDDSAEEEPEMKKNRWKLALQPIGNDEQDAKVSTSFCVRFMLYNMPKHRQHAVEVTFRQTQLEITIQEGYIQRVDMSTPEAVTIQVTVNGGGRAVVHGTPRDMNDDKAKQQNGVNDDDEEEEDDDDDDDNDNSGKKDDNDDQEEQQKGGMGELPPSAPTSTDEL